MKDKNGVEIKTGMIVEISGAYFKNDNGLYYVEHAPGDPGWCGKDLSLRKISRAGKISQAKYNIAFWPIFVTVSDRMKSAEASRWNAEHATIEVRSIKNMSEVAAHFQKEAENIAGSLKRMVWDWGEDHPSVQLNRAIMRHYEAVAMAIEE